MAQDASCVLAKLTFLCSVLTLAWFHCTVSLALLNQSFDVLVIVFGMPRSITIPRISQGVGVRPHDSFRSELHEPLRFEALL